MPRPGHTRRPTRDSRRPGRPREADQAPPTARAVAYARLADDAGHFPDLVPVPLETGGLDTRDAALAHAIHDAAIRRWWTLQAVLTPLLSKPFLELETKLRAALLGGSAQLILLDRLPPHAVIDETVEWAKRAIRPGAGGLVNAVLRRVAGLVGAEHTYRGKWGGGLDEIPLPDGRALVLAEAVLPAAPLDLLSAATSVPRPLLAAWADEHGKDRARSLALHTLAPAPVIFNAKHATAPVPGTEAHGQSDILLYTGDSHKLGELLSSRDDVWVQDPASGMALGIAADLSPRVIVDACAGRGTKTRQLSAMFPDAEIIATDTDAPRFVTLGRVFERRDNVRVVPADRLLEECLGRADLVLLDVPCSNTGVLARRPEAKYRFGPRQTERLTDTQRQIVADSVRLLARDGAILYSTCSLQHEENRDIAAWAGRWHGFKPEREQATLPDGEPGTPPSAYRDGGYAVLLRR
ncbi:MAG: hypothetical protein H6810_11175 [Phycisphaeraceae bacterium]|nr:MAG: hypothetical protein H6810_11175 [Phycisphaeraceae bacterium]